MQNELEQLNELQNEMLAQVDNEVQLEQEITDMAAKIAHDMSVSTNSQSEFEWNGNLYQANAAQKTLMHNNKPSVVIAMIIGDKTKFRILKGKYIPFTVTAELNNDLGWEANLRALLEAWFRHVSGLTDKAGELDG